MKDWGSLPDPSIRGLSKSAPLARLDTDHQPVTAIAVRREHRCLAFADIEPVLAECIDDVRLVRNDHKVVVGRRPTGNEPTKRLCASIILVWRNPGAAL